jgi:predicted nucleotidyltransferase component of viral defense system
LKSTKNISASVRQRLLNYSKNANRSFSEVMQYYAMERFLYRLSISPHSGRFILKGGLLLRVWQSSEIRPTMDIDLLGITTNKESLLITQIHEILSMDVVKDGLVFDTDSIKTEPITKNNTYKGTRILFLCKLTTAIIKMQIDIGFGDIIFPQPDKAELPTILDYPAPQLLCYSRESVIAEKFHAMVQLGKLNSRIKDFYDVWLLSRLFNFEAGVLTEAIHKTFEQRETILTEDVFAFTDEFIQSKTAQWNAFRKRLNQKSIPESFNEIVKTVELFISPLLVTDYAKKSIVNTNWIAPGPWI